MYLYELVTCIYAFTYILLIIRPSSKKINKIIQLSMFLINKKPPSFEAVNQPENKSLLAASLFVDSGYNIYHVNTYYSIYLSVSIPNKQKGAVRTRLFVCFT